MKLLLVDDSTERAELLATQLRAAGSYADVQRVSAGGELREALERESFDAVLCAAAVADLGVAVTLETLHRRGGNAPSFIVIESTGELAASDVLRALQGDVATPGPDASREDEARAVTQSTLDAIPEAALVVDFASRVPVANPQFLEMWRLPAEAVAGGMRSLLQSLPDTPRLIIELLELDTFSRSSGSLDLPDDRTVEWTSAPRMLEQRAIGRLWFFRDVSGTARAQRALERSEARYRSLIGNIPAVLWTANAAGQITFVSPTVLALDGYTPAEISAGGKDAWLARVHPEERDHVSGAYKGLFAYELSFEVEYRIQHKNGTWRWVHDRAMSTYERGGMRYADGVLVDITSRKLAELESNRLTDERELLLDSAIEGICGLDREGRVTFVNRAGLEALGFKQSELLGRRLHDLVHHHRGDGTPYPVTECPSQAALIRGERRRVVDEAFWKKDGTLITVEYNVAPILDRGEIHGAVIVFSDTTEQRALERAIEQSRRIDTLGRVAATIAHEFNNVLAAITPFAEVIRGAADGNRLLITASDHIKSSVLRGKRVTQEILRFTNASPALLQPVGVGSALRRFVSELSASLPPSCRLDLRVDDDSLEVLADWPQLEQVIANLVLNARDAMGGEGVITLSAGEGTTAPAASSRVSRPSNYVHLTCSDTGCGMRPEVVARVFEPLFTTKRHGTGLGLAVAQQVVTLHGGLIFVESEIDRGTTFHILLRKPEPAVLRAMA